MVSTPTWSRDFSVTVHWVVHGGRYTQSESRGGNRTDDEAAVATHLTHGRLRRVQLRAHQVANTRLQRMRQQLAPEAASLPPFNGVQNSGIFFKKAQPGGFYWVTGLIGFSRRFFYVNGDY